MSLDWGEVLRDTTFAVGARAPAIAHPRRLREARERPFEGALSRELDARLPDTLIARTGGTPGLLDFPALGPYDVSVSRAGETSFEAVLEFKWWGPPGSRGGLPEKRHETLWDVLKVACSIAGGRARRGYLAVLAPEATWRITNDFAGLFDGGDWSTRELCQRNPGAMIFFSPAHFGVTRVPAWVVAVPVATQSVRDPLDGGEWALKTIAIKPRGPIELLASAKQPPGSPQDEPP